MPLRLNTTPDTHNPVAQASAAEPPITDFSALHDLLNGSSEQLNTDQRTQLLTAITPRLGTIIRDGFQLHALLSLSSKQLNAEQRTGILTAIKSQLGTIIRPGYELHRLLTLSSEELNADQRTQLLTAITPQLGRIIRYDFELKLLLSLSSEELNADQRTQLLRAIPLYVQSNTAEEAIEPPQLEIREEPREDSPSPNTTNSFTKRALVISGVIGAVLTIGAGIALTLTGVFAPLGVGLMGLGVTVAVSALTGVGLGASFYMIGQKIKRHFVITEPLRYPQDDVSQEWASDYAGISKGLSGNDRTLTPEPETQEIIVDSRLLNPHPIVRATPDVPIGQNFGAREEEATLRP